MTIPVNPKHIVMVSNRLPVTVRHSDSGLAFERNAGGLATGLRSLQEEFEILWIGWPGDVAPQDQLEVDRRLVSEYRCHPVFIPRPLVEKYYDGYSNRALWPVFHSVPSYARYSAAEWDAYQEANALFARKIIEVSRPGDVIWVHDYHLMLVPSMLREFERKMTIGFFLHIPFPHYDIFRLLPQHREILAGALAFDLIGFHTHDYAQAFLGTVRRLLGYDNTLGQILIGDRMVQVDVFPMGIDFAKYSHAPTDPSLADEIASIKNSLKVDRSVFSVSRLDYTKGIPESLHAINEFLTLHPEWHERVVFILVVVPSRENVDRYASLKREIDELVGRFNSVYGTLEWQPIRYIYRSLTFGELIGLYTNTDVALVTPLRDGMNLIAKEYLATKTEGRGVLILSELTGASKELLEAITVNPNSKEEIAGAIHRALAMPVEEQQRRNAAMRERLRVHDLRDWVYRFFSRLMEGKDASETLAVKFLNMACRRELIKAYSRAATRLLILDYDGTLVPFADEPQKAEPDEEVFSILGNLAGEHRNHVVILSGRDRHSLATWLGHLHVTLVAEHGGWYRSRDNSSWISTMTSVDDSWKKEIRPILVLSVGRIPGSMIEEKDFSLVWHYRKAEVESASVAARELLDTLSTLAANLSIQVLPGDRTVEVRTRGIGKGAFYTNTLRGSEYPFILAVGDDWTDEDLFAVLPASAYSIKVAHQLSRARFNVKSPRDVRALLAELTTHRQA
jgi:trehalose 6-phosphate synthase/phosphatase